MDSRHLPPGRIAALIEAGEWRCALCGASGHRDEMLFKEHLDEEHPGWDQIKGA